MRLLTVELDDKDMAQLEAIARARRIDPAVIVKTEVLKVLDDQAAKETRRRARLAALQRSSGIWAGESGKPKDGVAYQEEMRAEWP